MSNPLLARAFVAEAAILANRIVKVGSADGQVLQAAAATDLCLGVVEGVAPASGERCDVVLVGIADVTLGATLARGATVTSDATGRAVATAAGNRAAGVLLASGVAGDIVEMLLTPGVV